MAVHPHAGKLPAPETLENIPALVSAYYTESPDPHQAAQRVSFGTSGHRGSSLKQTFNERHIHAITQAVCDYRKQHGISGPLFMGGIRTPCLNRPSAVPLKSWQPMTSRSASPTTVPPPRPLRSPTPSCAGTVNTVSRRWLTASSSRLPTTLRRMVASNIIRRMAVRPKPR